jgi:hypothetical protein
MIKLSYIVHILGHKDSHGKPAPWVIKSHETDEILSSHFSESEAKKHLQQMHAHSGSMIDIRNVKDIPTLLKTSAEYRGDKGDDGEFDPLGAIPYIEPAYEKIEEGPKVEYTPGEGKKVDPKEVLKRKKIREEREKKRKEEEKKRLEVKPKVKPEEKPKVKPKEKSKEVSPKELEELEKIKKRREFLKNEREEKFKDNRGTYYKELQKLIKEKGVSLGTEPIGYKNEYTKEDIEALSKEGYDINDISEMLGKDTDSIYNVTSGKTQTLYMDNLREFNYLDYFSNPEAISKSDYLARMQEGKGATLTQNDINDKIEDYIEKKAEGFSKWEGVDPSELAGKLKDYLSTKISGNIVEVSRRQILKNRNKVERQEYEEAHDSFLYFLGIIRKKALWLAIDLYRSAHKGRGYKEVHQIKEEPVKEYKLTPEEAAKYKSSFIDYSNINELLKYALIDDVIAGSMGIVSDSPFEEAVEAVALYVNGDRDKAREIVEQKLQEGLGAAETVSKFI